MTITVKNLNMGDSGNVVDADDYGRMNFKKVARGDGENVVNAGKMNFKKGGVVAGAFPPSPFQASMMTVAK